MPFYSTINTIFYQIVFQVALSYDDQSEKIGTNYQKTRPEIPSRNAGNLKARFENMAKQNEEEAKKRAEEEKKRREEKDKQVWFLNKLKNLSNCNVEIIFFIL